MHYHLDALGGIAGDMFAAALLDYHRDWHEPLAEAIRASGLNSALTVETTAHSDGVLTGHRHTVREPDSVHGHHHRAWRDIREQLRESALDAAVAQRAIAIFQLLAEAEAQVHGKAVDEVSFHEVGAWDSITDIVTAAWLIEHCRATSWSCSSIPSGRGRVETAHGQLPVPAPATALLLRGYPLFDDGVEGERVTPTGAAILKHLDPHFGPRPPRVLLGQGYGFGTQTFPGFSNVLRVSVFEARAQATADTIAVCQFEIDDQTAEDLATGLEHLREHPGVLDVLQAPVTGKKGRLGVHVQVLGELAAVDTIIERCFEQTTTLGIRWHPVTRATLSRAQRNHAIDGDTVRVKRASRPGGILTRKAEMDDLATLTGGHAGREQRRHDACARDQASDDADPPTEPGQ